MSAGSEFDQKHGQYGRKSKKSKAESAFLEFLKIESQKTDELISNVEDDNEDTLYCRSLAKQFAGFTEEQKAVARMRIDQVMYQVRFGKNETRTQSAPGTFQVQPAPLVDLSPAQPSASGDGFFLATEGGREEFQQTISYHDM